VSRWRSPPDFVDQLDLRIAEVRVLGGDGETSKAALLPAGLALLLEAGPLPEHIAQGLDDCALS
jgi:hypothetical protein